MSVLSLQNISFSYGKTPVLKDISYEFEKGKMYCIIGKSGAGKTTLLSLLSGLAAPNAGEIIYDGKNVAKIDKYTFRSKYIGVVFQSFNLITKYTALENVILRLLSVSTPVSPFSGLKVTLYFGPSLVVKEYVALTFSLPSMSVNTPSLTTTVYFVPSARSLSG